MTKLEQLINELCPNGVEYRTLGEMATIVRGASPRPIKNFITNNSDGVNWIKIGDVKQGSKYITETAEKITPEGAKKSRFVKEGDFILSNSMSFGRPYILKTKGCIHDGWLAISNIEQYFIPDFLYHLLNSNKYQQMMRQKASFGGAVQNLNADIVRELEMPVIALEVQSEIIRILDNFTELTAELTAELPARRQQYEYYNNTLLSFDNAEYKTLEELCDIVDYRGKTPRKVDDGIFLVTAKNIRKGFIDYDKSKEYISPEDYDEVMHRGFPKIGDVLITTEAPCGNVAQIDNENIALAQRVIKYRPKNNNLNSTFLKYVLLGKEFQDKLERAATGGTVKGIKGSKLHQLTIPVPSIEEQERIVAILERFDTLCNDISEGLPAEIEARQKQYEYYRDRLLTFEPAK